MPEADQQQSWLALREEESQRWHQYQQEQQQLALGQKALETQIENERRHLQECIDQLSILTQQHQQTETLLQQQKQQRQTLFGDRSVVEARQLLRQQFGQLRRIGFALRRFHCLSDQRIDGRFFPRAILLDRFLVRGQHLVDDRLQRT